MIPRPLIAAARRQLAEHSPRLPTAHSRQIASWALQPPAGYEPPAKGQGPGRGALLLLAGGAMALGAGLHHALQRPKHLSVNLQSKDTDTVMGAVMEGGLLRLGFEDAAKRLLISRAPHSRGLGAKFLLEHAPLEATVRTLQRYSETEADPIVEHVKPWSFPYLAPGGVEGALVENLPAVLAKNPGLEERLLAATDRDALRLRPLILRHKHDAEAQAELTAMLQSPDAIVRRRAVYGLHRPNVKDATLPAAPPAWLALKSDPDRMVRRQVCTELYTLALRDNKPAWFAPACEQLTHDADVLVSRFATAAIKGHATLYA